MTLKEITDKEAELRSSIDAADSIEAVTKIEADLQKLAEERSAYEAKKSEVEERFKKMESTKIENGDIVAPTNESRNILDTAEYRQAFMNFCQKGISIPTELRADATTTTTDASAAIPTTLLGELVKESKTFGEIYARVRKLNIQGGVKVPIVSLKPTATWVGEGTVSEDKKVQANTAVTFLYHTLEIKIAQTLLASVVTYDAFQREFVNLAKEAIEQALDIAIINGTGADYNQPVGIVNDTRIPAANKITMTKTELKSWADWKSKVFAKMKKSYRDGAFIMAQGSFDAYIEGMTDDIGQPIGRVNYGLGNAEVYRFGGKEVLTVEDEVLAPIDTASNGDVVAIFVKLDNYAINSNMELTTVEWTDNDNNKKKLKMQLIADGKLLDVNGVLLVKLGA